MRRRELHEIDSIQSMDKSTAEIDRANLNPLKHLSFHQRFTVLTLQPALPNPFTSHSPSHPLPPKTQDSLVRFCLFQWKPDSFWNQHADPRHEYDDDLVPPSFQPHS